MNLSTLAYTIGQRIGLVQDNDIKACKAFLQVRYDQLWRSFLWRDSLIEYVTPIDPSATYLPTSNYLPTKGHLILPAIFGQVIACRTNANSMNVQRPMLYYRMSQDEFTRTGSPLELFLLSAAVWEFDVAKDLTLSIVNAADVNQPVTLDLGAADGVSVNRSQVALTAASPSAGNSDLVTSITKPATQGAVSFNATPLLTTTILDFTCDIALPSNPIFDNANALIVNQNVLFVGSNGSRFTMTVIAILDDNTAILLPLAKFPATILGDSPWGTTMPSGAKVYLLSTPVTLQSADLSAPKCQRIRFVSIPNVATTVRVLGKRITPPFSADSDSPVINGMDGVLFGLGYYDMCARKNAQGTPEAQAALLEAVGPNFLTKGVAGGFLGKLIEEEVIQAASNTRIIPEGGFGDTGGNFGSWATKASPY